MALVYSSNQLPTTSADAFYRLVTHLVSAGWTVAAAGDGLSAYSPSSGTAVTSASSGANGFNNNSAWIFIKMPGSNRGFVFQVITAASNTITIRYFGPSTVVTNTPSATTAPVSTTTNAASQDVVSNVAYVGTLNRVNYWADNTAPYGFGMHGWSATGVPTFHLCLDGLQANTYHPLNQDPYVTIAFPNTNNFNFLLGYNGGIWARLNSNIKCWTKYNMTGATWRGTGTSSGVCMALPVAQEEVNSPGEGALVTIAQPISVYDNKDEEIPIQYVAVLNAAAFANYGRGNVYTCSNSIFVGVSAYIKNHLQWRSGTPDLDVISINSTYDRLCFGFCTVPNGGVFPSVP